MEERVPKFKILNHANISYSKLKNVIYIYLYIYFTSKRGAASSRKQFLWKIPVLQRKRSRVVFPPSLKVTGLVTQVFFLSMKATSVSTSCFVFWYLLSDQISRSVVSDYL